MPALSLSELRQNKRLIGFLVGFSFGVLFAAISPNIWWAGIIGGVILGVIVGRLFAYDVARDEELQRISRSPLADPETITGIAIPRDDDLHYPVRS
jgi:CDP-diglyceride synthetase